jgi:hypothetical protein
MTSSSEETIKVIVRLKGNEDIPESEKDFWGIDLSMNQIESPTIKQSYAEGCLDKSGGIFTFDKVLHDSTQTQMYEYTAKDTV